MLASLTSGVSGLRAHQLMLEVTGNNLANVNTPAFKGSRVTFTAALSETLRPAMSPSSTNGGTNPIQRGLGVAPGSIDVDASQGTLEMTGRTLDLAIQGDGFFVVDDGVENLFTRMGAFTLDANGTLVHSATGFHVLDLYSQPMSIPSNTSLPSNATGTVYMTGNLDAEALPPQTEVHSTITPLTSGGAAATASSTLNPATEVHTTSAAFQVGGVAAVAGDGLNTLDSNTVAYVDGDQIDITGADADGTPVSATFTYGAANDGTTLGDLRDAVSAAFSGATATLDGSGNLVLSADAAGEAALSIALADDPGNVGSTNWAAHVFAETAAGQDGLGSLLTPYVAGDQITVTGTDAAGDPVAAVFTYGAADDGTTLGDLRDVISAAYPDATCTIDASGNLALSADSEGPAALTISLGDGSGNTGEVAWNTHILSETTPGNNGATWVTTMALYDSQGSSHILTLNFEKVGLNTWNLTASLPAGSGTVTDGSIEEITFNPNGSFGYVSGTGTGDPGISIDFAGLGTQNVAIDFGTPGAFSGLTQFGGSFSAAPTNQDGYESGTLSTVSVRQDGVIQGTFTNGQVSDIGTLQLALFSNPEGLNWRRDGFVASTPNSGLPQVLQASVGGAGKIIASALENSNIDVAYEFTRLIVAQRGFQVNARTIGTTDEVLEELAHLIR